MQSACDVGCGAELSVMQARKNGSNRSGLHADRIGTTLCMTATETAATQCTLYISHAPTGKGWGPHLERLESAQIQVGLAAQFSDSRL